MKSLSEVAALVSASRSKLYHRCGEAWRQKYQLGAPDPSGAAAAVIAHFRAKDIPPPVATAPDDASSEEE